jgi:phospholipid transport system transporter-binding protein
VSKVETLTLPSRVDAPAAARLYAQLRGELPGTIDFAAVQEIDSAGLALVAELAERVRQQGRVCTLSNVTPRFAQLCAAHRVDKELLG